MKAYILLHCKMGKTDDVMEGITDVIPVVSITQVYGAYDIIVEIEQDTEKNLRADVIKIRQVSGITSTLTLTDVGNNNGV